VRPDIFLLYLPILTYLVHHFSVKWSEQADPADECDCEDCR